MKIGIVTFTTGDNFGQRLQNYALQTLFGKQKCDVLTLRRYDFRFNPIYKIKRIIKGLLFKTVRRELKRHKLFEQFNRKYIRFYSEIINSRFVSKEVNNDFDRFVVGSDQIWSPYTGDVDGFYFLNFAEKRKKYCYAPSFSANSIPDNKLLQYKEWIDDFSNLTCREFAGSELIENLTGRDTITVLDPTLLIEADEWAKLEKKPEWIETEEKYILKYCLGEEQGIDYKRINNGYRVINIFNNKSNDYICGPSEFLYLIHHAALVITDSYHGTIFSIIYQVPFVHCKRVDELTDMSSRFRTLFKIFDINEGDYLIDKVSFSTMYDEMKTKSMEIIEQLSTIEEKK